VDNFFTIVNLMTVTKFKYFQNSKVVLYFADGKVTFQRWEGDGTMMQVSVDTASNTFTCCIAGIFQAAYHDERLEIAGTDINGKEYRNTVYVGATLLQHEISMDELLEDDTDN
jgi:hypothetical protein